MSLPIEIQNSITRFYSLRQNENARINTQRREEIYTAIPQYKALCEQISSEAIACAKAGIRKENRKEELMQLKENQKKLAAYGKKLLKTYGYPEDYLNPHFFCTGCRDTGMANGKRCSCYKQFVVDQLYKASNLPAIREQNFETLDLSLYPRDKFDRFGRSVYERMQRIVSYCKTYAQTFSEQDAKSLLISGLTGTSKTFLCSCIAKVVLDAGYSVVYLSAADVFEKIHRQTWAFEEKDDFALSMYELFDCDLLIIDDLGSEPETANTANYFFRCINERLVRKHSTIISTNHQLTELSSIYTQRVVERITSDPYTCLLTTDGVEFNVRKFNKDY